MVFYTKLCFFNKAEETWRRSEVFFLGVLSNQEGFPSARVCQIYKQNDTESLATIMLSLYEISQKTCDGAKANPSPSHVQVNPSIDWGVTKRAPWLRSGINEKGG